jgi:hypothetical protein
MKTSHCALVLGSLLLACGCTAIRETAKSGEPASPATAGRVGAPGGGMPLFGVARDGKVDMAKRLLAEGANVNVRIQAGNFCYGPVYKLASLLWFLCRLRKNTKQKC